MNAEMMNEKNGKESGAMLGGLVRLDRADLIVIASENGRVSSDIAFRTAEKVVSSGDKAVSVFAPDISKEQLDEMKAQGIYTDTGKPLTVDRVIAKTANIDNLSLIVIDKIQLMTTDEEYSKPEQMLWEITSRLKNLTLLRNAPILFTAPLVNKTAKPRLCDLHGAIEGNADTVLLINIEGEPEIFIAKNRYASTASFKHHEI